MIVCLFQAEWEDCVDSSQANKLYKEPLIIYIS